MTPSPAELRRIAARIPEWQGRELSAEPLPGGLTNLNFRIRGADEDYVLRVTGDAEMLGADREAEYAATVIAGGLGIGPTVLAYLRDERMLVTRFVHGRPVPPEEMREHAMIARVARALRRLHAAPPLASTFSAFAIVARYRANAERLGVDVPDEFAWSWERAREMRPLLDTGSREPRLCHNDLLNANFLIEEGALRIVDWEYAGMGDPFFDLANLSTNHEFGDAEDEALLAAYFGEVCGEHLARLSLMRIMSDFREAMWGVVQMGLRTTDADYEAYARRFFARLRRRAEDPRYRDWLARAGGAARA